MQSLDNVEQKKEKILNIIRDKGPILPMQISKGIGVLPLFASAFLAELSSQKKLRMSYMKIGSSPLYYLEGQENLLEDFIEHLNFREKEAFQLLKSSKVLDDNELEPVMRVALRAVKDFAVPVRVRVDGDLKTFWRYFLLPEKEVGELIKDRFVNGGVKSVETEKRKATEPTVGSVETAKRKGAEAIVDAADVEEKKPETIREKNKIEHVKPVELTVQRKEEIGRERNMGEVTKKEKVKNLPERVFSKNIKHYLLGKDIEILEVKEERKREFVARVRADMMFGKQLMLLVAKDKKNVTDNDLTLALQKAQAEKMPALFVSPGILTKRAGTYLEDWGSLVKFERLRV